VVVGALRVDFVGGVLVVVTGLCLTVVGGALVVVTGPCVTVVGGTLVVVTGLCVTVVGGALVVVGALPQTGSPGSGALLGPPARKMVGTHTPTLPFLTHAHQWLARLPTEYFDPSVWHRNGYWLARKAPRGSVVPGRYVGAAWVTVQV
jgi:hypothetical protein